MPFASASSGAKGVRIVVVLRGEKVGLLVVNGGGYAKNQKKEANQSECLELDHR
jgi:hypothetical protein